MTNELAKTVATFAVWVSTAITLALGLYRMNGPVPLFVICTFLVMSCATVSMAVIWRMPKREKSPRGFDVLMPAQPVEKD